jgi:hypothetical protein
MPKQMSQGKKRINPGSDIKITVLNPACSSKVAERVPLAPRKFSSLEGKRIFLVDSGWGGPTGGYDVFEVMQDWFKQHIPSAKTILVKKKGMWADDDPALWQRIKAEGDAAIYGISC